MPEKHNNAEKYILPFHVVCQILSHVCMHTFKCRHAICTSVLKLVGGKENLTYFWLWTAYMSIAWYVIVTCDTLALKVMSLLFI